LHAGAGVKRFASQLAAPAQLGRVPRGTPLTCVHVPLLPVSAHDSHWPVQALSQHTPSAQCAAPQLVPLPFLNTHWPALQYASLEQSASLVHWLVHSALLPSHATWPAQAGRPCAPAGKIVQVPSALAPTVCAQLSQAPLQALSQHTPSLQEPLPAP
jgi:hypothetical protein